MTGQACPECGRRTTGEPGTEHRVPCRCGAGVRPAPLTEEEQRAARTAEIAAAEDFDPLRIRPYVKLTDDSSAPPEDVPGAAATTMPLFLDTEGRATATEPRTDARTNAGTAMGAGFGTDTGAGTGTGTAAGFGTDSVSGESRRRTTPTAISATMSAGYDPVQPRRRRPFAALAVGAAVASVIGTAAFAGGLFGGDGSQDEALPEATTSAPDTGGGPAASAAPSPSASATPSRTASPSPAPPPSPSASASPTRSEEPTPTATAPATPTAGTPSAPATGSATPGPPSAAPPADLAGPSLRRGDRGPEVAELQKRLMEVWLYGGPPDAHYSDRVENAVTVYQSYKPIQGDPAGVYGPNTRRALEAETSGRGRR
ncbi:peptidoglycan-binding protein [Streptomyces sp. WZ.A104]|uniref:peptidoglycan-binding domain-containing protein n=1 Tax=Streptomyces sp. WZ.A104 TaxID=2023771 RepID=UPI000BBBAB76|nr:peptidoglycan-binding domain-containing protein [Streptomyces sp. WZ.A104]PCG87674.1 peptidoglycan-binding protein [Streptomyces sp. WZ.A104]